MQTLLISLISRRQTILSSDKTLYLSSPIKTDYDWN